MPLAIPLALIALTSIFVGVGLPHLLVALVAGCALAAVDLRGHDSRQRTSWRTAVFAALATILLFLVLPLTRLAVPPGADMAMHTALARGLVSGSRALSPAWGSVTAPVYPRGFSALLALLSCPLGMARAALVASGLAYLVYLLGVRQLLLCVTDERRAGIAAALTLLVAKSPQRFYGFGANPTTLAIGLAALGLGAVLLRPAETSRRRLLLASLVLLGAAATHPIGALVGIVASAAVVLAVPEVRRRVWLSGVATAVLPAIAIFIVLAVLGPRLSDREKAWIADYQRTQESVLPGPAWSFPLSVLSALPRATGDLFAAILGIAALLSLRDPTGRTRLLWTWVSLVAVGGLLAYGGKLPGGGVMMYQDRFVPALILAAVPLVIAASSRMLGRHPRLELILAAVLLVLGTVRHFGWVQKQEPMATRADLQMLEWIRSHLPADAVIDGAYGDATQWVPAIADRAVTHPHTHISLEDEILSDLKGTKPDHWLVGERLRYPPAAGPPPADAIAIHVEGRAVLYARPR